MSVRGHLLNTPPLMRWSHFGAHTPKELRQWFQTPRFRRHLGSRTSPHRSHSHCTGPALQGIVKCSKGMLGPRSCRESTNNSPWAFRGNTDDTHHRQCAQIVCVCVKANVLVFSMSCCGIRFGGPLTLRRKTKQQKGAVYHHGLATCGETARLQFP